MKIEKSLVQFSSKSTVLFILWMNESGIKRTRFSPFSQFFTWISSVLYIGIEIMPVSKWRDYILVKRAGTKDTYFGCKGKEIVIDHVICIGKDAFDHSVQECTEFITWVPREVIKRRIGERDLTGERINEESANFAYFSGEKTTHLRACELIRDDNWFIILPTKMYCAPELILLKFYDAEIDEVIIMVQHLECHNVLVVL